MHGGFSMLKKLLITTALSGLMLSSALAQYSSPSSPSASPSSSPSATTPPSASSGDAMKSDASKSDTMKSDASKSASDTSKSTTGASASAIAAQKPDQLLASKVKGADVIGSDDKKIGDISDL